MIGISGSYGKCILSCINTQDAFFFPPAAYESFSGSASSSAILRHIVTSHNAFNFHFSVYQ